MPPLAAWVSFRHAEEVMNVLHSLGDVGLAGRCTLSFVPVLPGAVLPSTQHSEPMRPADCPLYVGDEGGHNEWNSTA